MAAYAIGLLNDLQFGQDIATYLERIDASLEPFGGAFVVHGAQPLIKEGTFTGDCVVIGFPSMAQASAWYSSAAYTALIPLRAQHAQCTIFLIEGVKPGHSAVSLLGELMSSTS